MTSMSAGRISRPALIAVLGLLVLLIAPGVATAAGTGGIEVTPIGEAGGETPSTTFRVKVPHDGFVEVPYLIRNVEDGPRSARIYAARVNSNNGNFSLDEEGSSPYVSMPDREVTLQPGEAREETFRVSAGPDGPPEDEAYAAVVVEVRNGAVIQRANTLIYLTAAPRVPLPLLLLVVAVLLLTVAGAGVALAARRRRAAATEPAEESATAS